ncbi:phosphotransferase family protein [Paenibacillus wynnii]|uniref:Aminoglycoside phosphotransferase domain-containing protein n=1 Tax=Paenibacillus wynnii TaxID=268407 RepID=A0A098M678_9BACL|nr:aminoglycoside phosphotransferase family protein [Paenibacillus wynnii]KGE18075.1 hypothetical protein PWYN_26410 [Paenibacillus wynnii]
MIEDVTRELESRYTCRLIRLTGGYTNLTFLMEGSEPLVAKVAGLQNHDTENEVNCLEFLKASAIAPIIHDVLEFSNERVLVMDYRPGVNGQSILDSGSLERALVLYRSLAQLLATKIHTHALGADPHGIRKSNAEQIRSLELDLGFVPRHLVDQSKTILAELDVNEQNWVLTHGDYGSHNILIDDDNNLNVLDWEWAEWGHPLNDVGWVVWFTKLHYPQLALVLNKAFVEEYIVHSALKSISPHQLKSGNVYKVWNILSRLQNAPPNVQAEWIRRLEWTLDTDFSW